MSRIRRHWVGALALLLCMADVQAADRPSSSSQPASTQNAMVTLRGWSWHRLDEDIQPMERFERQHPSCPCRITGGDGGRADQPLSALIKGEYDVALFVGPIPEETFENLRQGKNKIVDTLRDAKCDASISGRAVMAVVVHPQNPLNEIDYASLQKVAMRSMRSWKELGQADREMHCSFDDRCYWVIAGVRGDGHAPGAVSDYGYGMNSILRKVAKDPEAMGLVYLDKTTTETGLKILPVRFAQNEPAVAPSRENILSFKYPLQSYRVLGLRPSPSPAAREWAAEIVSPARVSRWRGWIGNYDIELPPANVDEVWPQAGAKAPSGMEGTAAILPTNLLAVSYLFADAATCLAVDDAIQEGFSQDAQLKLVDRAEIVRVMQERKLAMATGGKTPGPVLAADVLVTSYITTAMGKPCLLVEAIHAPTATPLGWVRITLDAARQDGLLKTLPQMIRQWWPGVLRNLVAARTKPVWSFPILPTSPEVRVIAEETRQSLRKVMLADDRIFLADYAMIPESQRELLMNMAGLSRPRGGKYASAGDYVLELEAASAKRLELRVLGGTDLKTLQQETFAGDTAAAKSPAWLAKQIGAFVSKPKPATRPTEPPVDVAIKAANSQAQAELDRARTLREQYADLRRKAYARARGGLDISKEDQKELDRLEKETVECCARAAQLDPTMETAAWQSALGAANLDQPNQPYMARLRNTQALAEFVDTFPRSPNAEGAMARAVVGYYILTQCLKHGHAIGWGVPMGLDLDKEWRRVRREQMRLSSMVVIKFVGKRDARPEGRPVFDDTVRWYYQALDAFALMDLKDGEADEIIAEYAKAADAHPDVLKPSDSVRLHYCLVKRDYRGYADVLTAMQKRWPDPKDAHWSLIRDEIIEQASKALETDPRRLSFYQWLRGKHGPGDHPWEGFDPVVDAPKTKPSN